MWAAQIGRPRTPGVPRLGKKGPLVERPPEAGGARRGPGRRGSRAGGGAGSGEASLGRGRGRSGAARGLRAAGGGLARGGGSRRPAPRLSGDAATSGGGPRRPGMAAWSPAAAAPLLRGIRGLPLLHCARWVFASQTEGERKVTQILKEKFPGATAVQVTDISGEVFTHLSRRV